MAIGWILLCTHFGAVIAGSRSVRCRIISKDAEPDPMTMPACRTTVSMLDPISIWPTFARDARWRESSMPSG